MRHPPACGPFYRRCLKVAQFPFFVLDLVDQAGDPDHGKIVPFLVLCGFFYLLLRGAHIQVTLAIAMLAGAFGNSMFRAFLRRSTFRVADVTQHTDIENHLVIERRDQAAGVDPA